MDTSQIEHPPVDTFDAAVTAESTYVEPKAEPAPPRDDAGKFAKPEGEEDDTPPTVTKTDERPRNRRDDPRVAVQAAIAKQREAERRADEATRRAEEAERRAAARPAAPEPQADPAKADAFADFATWIAANPQKEGVDPLTAYMNAHYRWNRDREVAVERAERETSQLEHAFSARATKFSETYAAAVATDADLPARIDPQLLQVRPYSNLTSADKALIRSIPNAQERDAVAFRCFLADQWIESEHSVALLEHLSDPQTFQRLAALPPNHVIRELARFEAGLGAASRKESSGPARETTPASHARAPIKPLGTTSPVQADDDGSDDEPIEKFIHRENAKDRKSGRL